MMKPSRHFSVSVWTCFFLCLPVLAVAPASLFGQFVPIPTKSDQITQAQRLLEEGNALMGKGDMQQAAQKYSDAIAASPSLALLYVNRSVAYLSLSKSVEALADAEKALSLLSTGTHPPNHAAIAYQVKGTVYQNRLDYKLATESFSKSIELEPSNAVFWNSRGNAYLFSKEYAKALKDYDKAIELSGAMAMFYINRATVHIQLKDIAASLRDLDEALRLDDGNANAFFTRGSAQIKLGKYEESLKDFDRAISLKPKAPFYHARGQVYYVLGKHDLAIKDNTEALGLEPSNIHALYNRALSYHRLGKNSLAIEDIRKAVALKETSGLMRYMLAYLLFKTGQFSTAAAEATRSMELAPQWRNPYSLRAACYAKLGNAVKSRADRAAALKLGPGQQPVEDAIFFELGVLAPEDVDQ